MLGTWMKPSISCGTKISSVEESQRGVHVLPEHRLRRFFKRKTDIRLQMNVQMEHSVFQHALYVFT